MALGKGGAAALRGGRDRMRMTCMITRTPAVAFRQNLGEMLNRVQYRRMQARFDALCGRIERGFASMPQEGGPAEIEAAVAAEREGRGPQGR